MKLSERDAALPVGVKMDNVFDLVAEFYNQDEEWNDVIARKTVEDYLRSRSWRGSEREELFQCWDDICIFCIYLGHSDNILGGMSEAAFIDCVGWCVRNVSDFAAEAKNVERFLLTLADFYKHIGRKCRLSDAGAPERALQKLVMDGELRGINSKGEPVGIVGLRNIAATPDLPAKMFLNIGNKAFELLQIMEIFFSGEDFKADLERARFLYDRVYNMELGLEMYGSEEYFEYFWDYFLFDYHLLQNYKRPIEHFYSEIFAADKFTQSGVFKDILEELLKAELVIFSVEYSHGNDYFSCRNLLTGEMYTLGMAVDENIDFQKALFIGHIFYNNTMVVNSMRGVLMHQSARKKFKDFLNSVRMWSSLRFGKTVSWKKFIGEYALAVRNLFLVHAFRDIPTGRLPKSFGRIYLPANAHDSVTEVLDKVMSEHRFSRKDIDLAQAMWADFKSCGLPEANFSDAAWAAGVVANFIKVNDVYAYDIGKIADFFPGVTPQEAEAAGAVISKSLEPERFDPRYINEEGMLFMLFS